MQAKNQKIFYIKIERPNRHAILLLRKKKRHNTREYIGIMLLISYGPGANMCFCFCFFFTNLHVGNHNTFIKVIYLNNSGFNRNPTLAQLVERRTVVSNGQQILRSLVRIRQVGLFKNSLGLLLCRVSRKYHFYPFP
jgi:hypothetical protein